MHEEQVVPILKLHSELDAGAPVSLPFLKDNQSVCVYYVSLLVCLCVCTSVCLEACLLARHVRQPGAQSRPLDAAWGHLKLPIPTKIAMVVSFHSKSTEDARFWHILAKKCDLKLIFNNISDF